MTEELRVSVDEQGEQGSRVALSGPLDVATAEEFLATVGRVPGDRDVLLDLSQLDHLDSVGFAALLRAVDALRRCGEITLRRAPARVHRLFVLTGADRRLPFEGARPQGATRLRGELR